MFDLFWIIVGSVALFGTSIGLWRFGHAGTWGCMLRCYKSSSPNFDQTNPGEIIYIKIKDKWIQWNLCSVNINQESVDITQSRILNWAVPSLRIPIADIIISSEERPWFGKYIALKFSKNSCQLAIKFSHLEEIEEYQDTQCAEINR